VPGLGHFHKQSIFEPGKPPRRANAWAFQWRCAKGTAPARGPPRPSWGMPRAETARFIKAQIRGFVSGQPAGRIWPRRPVDRRNADSKPPLDLHGRFFHRAVRLLRKHRDDPTLERAVAMFVYRTDHPRDRRSHKRQRCFSAPILGKAGASRFGWIGCFDGVHNCARGRGTRNKSATRAEVISETLSNDSGADRCSQNTGISTARPSAKSELS
jgi:hypothetical protein